MESPSPITGTSLLLRFMELKQEHEGGMSLFYERQTRLDLAIAFCSGVIEETRALLAKSESSRKKGAPAALTAADIRARMPWCQMPIPVLDLDGYAEFVANFIFLLFNPQLDPSCSVSKPAGYLSPSAAEREAMSTGLTGDETILEVAHRYLGILHAKEPHLQKLAEEATCGAWKRGESPMELYLQLRNIVRQGYSLHAKEAAGKTSDRRERQFHCGSAVAVNKMRKKYATTRFCLVAGGVLAKIIELSSDKDAPVPDLSLFSD